jgi:capsular exopolysaccharide synthesis family protein
MSLVHDMLTSIEEKEHVVAAPWSEKKKTTAGLFVLDMPNEILSDFYDLKEHIRLANMRDDIRTLSIANSSQGEGSPTIATYLAFLMAGGVVTKLEKKSPGAESRVDEYAKSLHSIAESDKIFTNSFQSLTSKSATSQDIFKNWQNDVDSRYMKMDNSDCILLVDANMHKPSIHRFFGTELEHGLGEIIESGVDWNQMAKPVRDSNLKLITAGVSDRNPADLLGSERFKELVEEWKKQFRYVIFDSPAVLNYVESLSIAAVVDGVVLVVRAGQTRWDIAQNAKQKLTTAHANLLGVTLNRRKMDIPDGLYKRLI